LRTKPNRGRVHAPIDDALQTRKGSTANEKNVGGINLQKVATRILATRFLK
jgi:hypothetical protein